jgi:hypothetical protein
MAAVGRRIWWIRRLRESASSSFNRVLIWPIRKSKGHVRDEWPFQSAAPRGVFSTGPDGLKAQPATAFSSLLNLLVLPSLDTASVAVQARYFRHMFCV